MAATNLSPIGDFKDATSLNEKQYHDAMVHPASVEGRKISVAEYIFYADEQRKIEATIPPPGNGGLFALFKSKEHRARRKQEEAELKANDPLANWDTTGLSERQIELNNARRVLRMASWGAVFYLITCDILGPFGAPYSIAQIGLVPGITLYLLFGIFAIITGFMIAKLYLRLDSIRYPVKTFGDIAERVLGGAWARHFTSALQAVQLVLNCGLLCLSKGQSLSQISRGPEGPNRRAAVCSLLCVMVFALVGCIMGQVRSLKGFGLIANFSVWLNILIMVLSMGFIANSPPNFLSAAASYGISEGPIVVSAVVTNPIFTQVNGVFNMVFAYGGAMIFPEIMAEMRRPRDFIKGAAMAQVFIMFVYLFYGVFIYCFQGQFTLPVAYQGVSKYAWQTIGNSIALVTGAVAAGLYGNIGLKVVYIHIVEDLFKGPPLMSKKGHLVWTGVVFVWWGIAYIIGTGIPAVGALSGLVAAVCIFQFTYTFPPLFMLALDMHIDAAEADAPWSPGQNYVRVDTWKDWSRWKRGFFNGGRKRLMWKVLNVIYLLGALATAGLGMWASGRSLKEAYDAGTAAPFKCKANV